MGDLEAWDEASEQPIDLAQMDAIVKAYKTARDDYDKKKEISNAAAKVMEEAKAKVIDALNAAGKRKYHVDGIGTVTRRDDLIYSYPKDTTARKAFHQYVVERYGQETLSGLLSINAQTFKAWANKEVKARAEEGLSTQLPGIADPTVYENVVFRGEGGSGEQE